MAPRYERPEQSHKDSAAEFLRFAAEGKVLEAYNKYISADFRHHNAFFRGDAESLKVGMEENAAKFPNRVLEIQRVLEDGNLVAVHSRMKLSPSDVEVALVHIFRFQGDRITEMWDIVQPVPEDTPNEYGMF